MYKDLEKRRATDRKRYRRNRRKILKRQRDYYQTHKNKILKKQKEYQRKCRKSRRDYVRKYQLLKRSRRGLTPETHCVNGCKVPWYILENHHLKNRGGIVFCPNRHALYHRKLQRERMRNQIHQGESEEVSLEYNALAFPFGKILQ